MIFDAYETYSTFLLMGNSLFSFFSQTHGNVKKKKLEWRHQVTIMNHSDSAASLSIVISSEGIWFPDENEKNDLWISVFITASLLCFWYNKPIKIFYFMIKTFYLHLCTVCTIVPISHLQYCLKVLSHLLILYIWFSGSFSLDTGCVFIHFESSPCSWQQGNPCCVYTKTAS